MYILWDGKYIGAYSDAFVYANGGSTIPATGVSLDQATASIAVGESITLIASLTPSNASYSTMKWSSNNTAVASVSSSGKVTGVGAGKATITVTVNDQFTASCTVTVTPKRVTGVTMSKSTLALSVGKTGTLTATVVPSDASNKAVTWVSGNPSVASVSSSGVVTALTAGSTTITATTGDGGYTATCDVTVTSCVLTASGLSYSDQTAIPAENGVYKVDGWKYTAEKPLALVVQGKNYTAGTTYTVSMKAGTQDLGSVSVTGEALNAEGGYSLSLLKYTGQNDGNYTYTISVKDDTGVASGSLELNVVMKTPVKVSGIGLNRSSAKLDLGDNKSLSLTARIQPTNAENKNVTWTSSDESVATISSAGAVTSVGLGTATITVTSEDGGYQATCVITVGASVTGTLSYGGAATAASYTYVYLYTDAGDYYSYSYTNDTGAFSFSGIPIGSYKLKAYSNDWRYQGVECSFTITADDKTGKALGTLSYSSKYSTGSLSVNINGTVGNVYEVYISSGGSVYYYANLTTISGTPSVTFDDIPYDGSTIYYISVYDRDIGSYISDTVTVSGAVTSTTVTVPVRYKITGKVTTGEDSDPVPYTSVIAVDTGDGSNYYGYTDAEGNYSVSSLPDGTYNVSVYSYSGFKSAVYLVNLAAASQTCNISATQGLTLRGSITINGKLPYKAYVTLTDTNGNYISSGYSTADGYVFERAITAAGEYKIAILRYYESANSRYISLNTMQYTDTITVVEPLDAVRIENFNFTLSTNAAEAFRDDGNSVATDLTLVHNGSSVSLVVKYQNNSDLSVSGTFTASLPSGLTLAGGSSATFTVNNLAPGTKGQQIILLNTGVSSESYLRIPVTVEINGTIYDFGVAELEYATVTLSGSGAVKTGDSFKVYGEATAGSAITIKNAVTGEVLGYAQTSGRWYSTSIRLNAAGDYRLVAEAVTGGLAVQSDVLNVNVKDKQTTITEVKANGSSLSVNKRIGVRTFSTYVDSSLRGFDIPLYVKFESEATISGVTFHFADSDFPAALMDGYYYGNLTGWYGSGVKTITATVETDAGTLTYIIAEVTILIDPSGIITDAETGKVVSGATVYCDVWNASASTWDVWDAEAYGQSNPMQSDVNGYYGWMVPAGTYRIRAYKDGYREYTSTFDSSFSDGSHNSTIIIPPPRTDVNFSIEPTSRVTAIELSQNTLALNVGSSQTLLAAVIPVEAVNRAVTWTSSNTSIATISADGTVTAITAGTATITASFSSTITAACDVTISGTIYIPGPGGNPGGLSNEDSDDEDTDEEETQEDVTAFEDLSDIPAGSWYYDYVKTVVDKGLMKGTGKSSFAPQATMTRAMFVTVLYRMAGLPAVNDGEMFTDVDAESWYADAAKWASELGIVKGVGTNAFAPDAAVTREQLAVFMYRYAMQAELVSGTYQAPASFSDYSKVSDWAKDAMNWAVEAGLITGNDGALLPGNTATRAEVAAILARFLTLVEE